MTEEQIKKAARALCKASGINLEAHKRRYGEDDAPDWAKDEVRRFAHLERAIAEARGYFGPDHTPKLLQGDQTQ